jgi:hypothetical protein
MRMWHQLGGEDLKDSTVILLVFESASIIVIYVITQSRVGCRYIPVGAGATWEARTYKLCGWDVAEW